MRTREAFRDALQRVARFEPAQTEPPAFTYLPGPHSEPQPAPAGISAPVAVPAAGGRMIAATLRDLQSGSCTVQRLVAECYDAIEKRSDELNAFTYVRPRVEADQEAAQLDAELRQGKRRGPLHGIPITVKDVIHVRGMPTTASSKVPGDEPQTEDAAAVAALRAAGALVLGKTSTHEFALGVTTPQSRNPWDPARLAGGSSGGSAIALAAGMCLGSLGTDTRASIRVPAALCGVVGYKATYGLIPTDGVVTLSWSMDHAAPMAKTVEDVALLLDVLATGPANGVGSYHDALGISVRGLRVGVPAAGLRGAEPAVAEAFDGALQTVRGLGHSVIELGEPDAEEFTLANAAGLIVSRVEAAAFHQPWLDRRELYTEDVREQLDEARQVSGVEYVQAQRYRADLRHRMLRLLSEVDVLALPTSKVPAPRPEESEAMLLVLSENCVPWSFLGFPAISLPCGAAPGNLPVGLELVAAPYRDRTLLALSAAFEAAAKMSYV